MKISSCILLTALYIAQAQAFTLPRHDTKAYDCDVCAQLSHETLHDKWEISNQPLFNARSNAQKSYGYKEKISLDQLAKGVTLSTRAPGAVVRITPLEGKPVPELRITTSKQQQFSLQDASALYSRDTDDESLLAMHQTLFQLKPALGAGQFVLKSEKPLAGAAKEYLISVFDKYSSNYLEIETDAVRYQYGDTLNVRISLNDDEIEYDVDDITAVLVGPAGQTIPLTITKVNENQFRSSIVLNSESNDHGENWYIETDIYGIFGLDIIRRSGHTAFSYAVPSATLAHVKKLSSHPLTFAATIEVATASRYALQSVLYQKGKDGEALPIETSQKAQWFEPGRHLIEFTFDNSGHLNEDSLYLGYLRLIDYGQLRTVYEFNQPVRLTQLRE